MLSFTLILIAFLSLAVSGAPTVTHERRSPHSHWAKSGLPLNKAARLPLRFGLKQQNLHRLEEELLRVSHPESEHYSKLWTPDEVSNFFAPPQEAEDDVLLWLRSSGFDAGSIRVIPGRSWIEVDASIDEAEKLLRTEYHHFTLDDQFHIACDDYKVPEHIARHLDIVVPTVHFDVHSRSTKFKTPASDLHKRDAAEVSSVRNAAKTVGQPGSASLPKIGLDGFVGSLQNVLNRLQNVLNQLQTCDKITTLDCLKALYNFEYYKSRAVQENSYAVVEYTPQSLVYSDLNLFYRNYSPSLIGKRPKVVSIDGGVVNQAPISFSLNGESNLDFMYSTPFVAPLTVDLYQVGDPIQFASFNNFLDAVTGDCNYALNPSEDGVYPDPASGGYKHRDCGTVKPALVISTSYGMNEADATPAYLKRQCAEYGKLGLMGTTVLFSSGDSGVAGNGDICLNRDGTQSSSGKIFNPTFPGTCPYVTSVGATQIPAGSSVFERESACYSIIYSGGGFSNIFPIPEYQRPAVSNYYSRHNPPYTSGQYNNSREVRGYPDLSANGANYVVAIDGEFGLVYGTSASSPVVGSILTLINDARLAIGKKSIGFINPTIYSPKFALAFNDIINGTNPGCGTNGFKAVPGWDPVTGLGTPNFAKLLPLWLALP